MSDYIKRASRLLEGTEKALRDLVSESAMSGDYSSVVLIAEWAKSLHQLLQESGTANSGNGKLSTATKQLKKNTTSKPASRPAINDYPRFLQQGNELIRVAWSKREKREYRHKAPYSAVEAVARAMHEKGVEGRVFSTDDFLPLRDGEATDIPNYQAYVAIALFKHTGLIDQHGRQGYSIRQPHDFRNAVETLWRNLPKQ